MDQMSERDISTILSRPYVQTEEFISNSTNMDLWLARRDGTVCLIPTNGMSNNTIIVGTRVINRNQSETVDIARNPKRLTFNEEKFDDSHGRSWHVVDDIKAKLSSPLNGFYLELADVFIYTTEKSAVEIGHIQGRNKFDPDIYAKEAMGLHNFDPKTMVNINLRIVDNKGRYQKLYSVINKEIVTLVPMVDPDFDNGLYVAGFQTFEDRQLNHRREEKHYTFDEVFDMESVTPFKLFTSYNKASSYKNEDNLRLEEEKMKHDEAMSVLQKEIEILKKESTIAKSTGEIVTNSSKQQLERDSYIRDREMMELKYRNEILKTEYDRRSDENKQLTETIKTVGLVAAAGVALWKILS